MRKLQRVTVALALCESDAGLLRYAALVARLGTTSEIHFVHVVTPAHNGNGVPSDGLLDQMRESVREHFGEVEGIDPSFHVLHGVRVDELVKFVTERRMELILLGHRKHRSGRRYLAQRLAMVTPCSVWMAPEGAPARISRILAPIDFSENSADSLSQGAALASLLGLDELTALHVFFDPSTVRYDERIDEFRGRESLAFARFQEGVNTHGVRIDPVFMESNNVARSILRCAERQDADLIVMSTRGRSRAASILLGSETAQTLMESPIPVLAVKHFGANLNFAQALISPEIWSRPGPKTN